MRRGLLAVLTLIAATGCGGSSSPPSAQLRDQATRICGPANRALKRITAPSSRDYRSFLGQGIAVLEPELARLRSLRARGDESDVLAGALAALGQEIAQLSRARQALDHGQDPALVFAALGRRLSPIKAEADAAWRALQIPGCLSG